MALLESCYCCSLSVCCGVLGVYLLVAYVISFAIELWWILEAQVTLPVPAYLLSFGYFSLFLFSSFLLHGLSVKKSTYLLIWMFLLGILLGPEAGLVLYMSIHHWRIETLYGLVEVTCWACRLLVNICTMICVQSLYSTWKEEKTMMLRLQALKMSPVPGYHRDRLSSMKLPPPPRHDYLNHGYQPEEIKQPRIPPPYPPQEENVFMDPFFVTPMTQFNASTFDAQITETRKPQLENIVEEDETPQKTQSLLDFRDEDNNVDTPNNKNRSISLSYVNYLGKKEVDNITQSLDRGVLKTSNKLIRKLSPFLGRKTYDEINVYQVHPPKIVEQVVPSEAVGRLDSQLNQVYSNRGMYAFDDRSKKLIFYPPEFFNREEMKSHRNRGSSRSSFDDDSEENRRIGDVAL